MAWAAGTLADVVFFVGAGAGMWARGGVRAVPSSVAAMAVGWWGAGVAVRCASDGADECATGS